MSRLKLIGASGRLGKRQTGIFGGAIFKATQARSGLHKGLSTLSLLEGDFPGAPSYASCNVHLAADAHTARLSRGVLQSFHASAHGRYRTRGRYSAATVRGTIWDTIDRCDGTLTKVHRGTVQVTDFARRKTIIIHAGHSYLAKAIKRHHK